MMELQSIEYYFDQIYEMLHKFPLTLFERGENNFRHDFMIKLMFMDEDINHRLEFDKLYYGVDLSLINRKIKVIEKLIINVEDERVRFVEDGIEETRGEEDIFEAVLLMFAQLCESVTGSITEQHIAILLTATYGNEKVNQTTKAKELLIHHNLSGESQAVNRVVATWNRRIFNKSLKRQEFDLISRFWKDGKELKISVLD